MIKRICDRCGSEDRVQEYELPVREEVLVEYSPYDILSKFTGNIVLAKYDLCYDCALKVASLLDSFMKDKQ